MGQKLQNQSHKQLTDDGVISPCGSPVNLSLWLSWKTWDEKAKPEKCSGNKEEYILHLTFFTSNFVFGGCLLLLNCQKQTGPDQEEREAKKKNLSK